MLNKAMDAFDNAPFSVTNLDVFWREPVTTTDPKPKAKGPNVVGALTDFLILVLMIGGAGFGGYFFGTTQRLAPVKLVAPGTPGAVSPEKAEMTPVNTVPAAASSKAAAASTAATPTAATTPATPTTTSTHTSTNTSTNTSHTGSATPAANTEKKKYWLVSSGSEYVGYAPTVNVNGKDVDNFFGPGKTQNITKLVKEGENSITFNAKHLEAGYNKHKGDASAELIIQLVSGPFVTDEFSASDVLLTYKRNAAETDNFNDTKHFVKE